MVSKQTATQIFNIIKKYVPGLAERGSLLAELRLVDGNRSYRHTVEALIELHNADNREQDVRRGQR